MPGEKDDVFSLDKYALDKEYVRQIDLRREYARKAADAAEEHRRRKAALKVMEAEVKMAIRQDPVSFGLNKLTEDSIENAMTLDKKYQKALSEEISAEHDENIHIGYLKVLDDRKQGLQDLTKLVIGEFYAHPKIDSEHWQQVMQEAKEQHHMFPKSTKKRK